MSNYSGPLKARMKILNPRELPINYYGDDRPNTETSNQPGEQFSIIRTKEKHNKAESSDELVKRLIKQYGTEYTRPTFEETSLLRSAFPKVADKILETAYDGSKLLTDSKQDLLGERYLAEQIKLVNAENKKKSILDSYSYMLYEGDRSERTQQVNVPFSMDLLRNVKPIKTTTFVINN